MSVRFPILVWGLLAASSLGATEVKIFRAETREAVLQGTLEQLSVDPLGTVALARDLDKVTTIEEPFVFSIAGLADGWLVGTGNSGKVLEVGHGGEVEEIFTAPEPEIFAVYGADDGTRLAASSPNGKVYRLTGDGEGEAIFESGESYVWDLERDSKGRLLVATGLSGRLYRVSADGSSEVLYSSRDSHVRAIAVLPDGAILLGTAGQGLIVRIDGKGEVTTLHDAVHPEVLSFAVTPSGRAYAAVLASEASFVDLSSTTATTASADDSQGEATAAVTVAVQGSETIGSRSSSFSGPRSLVLEIATNGDVKQVAAFQRETIHALAWHDDELWIGTGQEGRLYRLAGEDLIQEAVLEERQIAGLMGGPGAAVLTANASAIYSLNKDVEDSGTLTSKVLDAGHVARFGSFLWRGNLPPGGEVELAFRSGMSATPDATWTDWASGRSVRCAGCEVGSGQETALAGVAHGRYVQWRARLTRDGDASPRLSSSELTYRPDNIQPEIEKLEVLDPGQILVPSSFNPQNQTFEPWSPNRQGIFTTLRLDKPKNGGSLKTLWKRGYRTLRWTAKDANEDKMIYRLEFRPEADEKGWLPMVDEIKETHYSFDATALPDGIYRFRLVASDRGARDEDEAMATEKLSESVVIDHSSPKISVKKARGSKVVVEINDALSPMRDVALSLDAGEWRSVRPSDGILDGRRETLEITLGAETRMALLRVTDAAHNVVTWDLLSSVAKSNVSNAPR